MNCLLRKTLSETT